jgi:glycerophosphoryl diester phosphodiesterase
VVAHRGDPYAHRENTLPSLLSAVREGADAVETDVRLTRDGLPVLVHDATLERLWERRVPVAGVRARDLPPGVPSLAEALAALDGTRLLLDLPDESAAGAAVAAVRAAGGGERAWFCGDAPAMLAVREHDRDAEIALTWTTAAPVPPALLALVRPRWLNLRFGLVSAPLVARARADGLLVSAWTADTGLTMRRLLRAGVDAITSNRVALLRRTVDAAARS